MPLVDLWQREQARLLAVLLPRLTAASVSGAEAGSMRAAIAFDAELMNVEAERWARRYTDDLLSLLGSTSQRIVGDAVADWIAAPGRTRQDLIAQLEGSLLVGQERAAMIAATETTRAFAHGEKIAYQQAGIRRWRWHTRQDELVCPLCGPLNGREVEIGKPFGMFRGQPITEPPFHPYCRCGVAPVGAREPQEQRGPARDTIALAGRLRDVHMFHYRDTRVVIPVDMDAARQVLDERSVRQILDMQGGLPHHLQNVVREIRLTDGRDADLEAEIARRYGIPVEEGRVTASVRPHSGVITFYANGDLHNDPTWPGALRDGAHELGHRVAERLWGDRFPRDSEAWRTAMLADENMPSDQAWRGQDEDWAATFALWMTDPPAAQRLFPYRVALLLRWIEAE